MVKSKSKTLPHFRTLDELISFFDRHDFGEYWHEVPEAHFEVDIKRRVHLFVLDDEVAGKLTEIAKSKQLSSETLINAWLKEKVEEQL